MRFKKKDKKDTPNNIRDTTIIFTPSKADFLEMEERIIWTNDGDMYRYCISSVFPQFSIGGASILNIYGQKIYNDLTMNKEGE